MGEIRKTLQENLNIILSKKKISQKELANRLNVSQAAVTNWKKGKNSPDIETVYRLCEVLDVPVTELLSNSKSTNEFTELEKQIIYRYRECKDMQLAIRVLLDIK